MSTSGRPSTPRVWFTTAWAAALVLPLALGLWSVTRAATVTQAVEPHPSSTAVAAAAAAANAGRAQGAPSAPTGADALRGMDPTVLDRQSADEELTSQGGAPASAKGTWLVGAVGTYVVGRGIPAGTYASAAPGAGRTCRWAVSRADGTKLRSGTSRDPSVVTIHPSDGFFATDGCSNWHRLS